MPWYEGATRHDRIAAAIRHHHLDALLALTPENAAYLSGRTSLIATLWRVPGLIAVAVDPGGDRAVSAGDAEVPAYPADRFARFAYRLWIEHLDLRHTAPGDLLGRLQTARPEGPIARPAQYDPDEVFDAVAAAVHAIAPAPRRLGVDLASLPTASLERLRRRLPSAELVDATVTFDNLRAVKDDAEIANLRLAAELTETGIAAARDRLRPGLPEPAVMAAYQTAIWDRAATDGRYAALRRVEGIATVGLGVAPPVVVEPGQTVRLDMQVNLGGYHSDIGRTFALAPTPDQRAVYTALRNALAAAETAVAPGAACRDIFRAGTDAMRAAGFVGYSRGHLGHSVGLAPNYEEPPFLAADENRPLVPGMVISLELPYYLHGVGALQLERMLLITADGHEALDRLPFRLEVEP